MQASQSFEASAKQWWESLSILALATAAACRTGSLSLQTLPKPHHWDYLATYVASILRKMLRSALLIPWCYVVPECMLYDPWQYEWSILSCWLTPESIFRWHITCKVFSSLLFGAQILGYIILTSFLVQMLGLWVGHQTSGNAVSLQYDNDYVHIQYSIATFYYMMTKGTSLW